MILSLIQKTALFFYNTAWIPLLPLLRLNRRLAEGYNQRRFRERPPKPVEIWIQAASVGESFLAWELLKRLKPEKPVNILITTNTRQGLDILEKAIRDVTPNAAGINPSAGYFPFDKPGIMRQAVEHLRPEIMVLLETEMWPGHLTALKEVGCRILIVNGRMTTGSLKGYLLWPSLWQRLRPDRVLAISEEDAARFRRLFGAEGVAEMPNIKFDRVAIHDTDTAETSPLADLFPADAPILVLGSVRREEEGPVQQLIREVLRRHPKTVIALFPRHLHRQKSWISFMDSRRIPWQLRSMLQGPAGPGSVILWDTFGELSDAYRISTAAFVGGSLAPLGGQNFLEPLTSGVRPVIGPFWENFHWVGREIVAQGLVKIVSDWRQAADVLSGDISHPRPVAEVRAAARKYVTQRQGGAALACALIEEYLRRRTPS